MSHLHSAVAYINHDGRQRQPLQSRPTYEVIARLLAITPLHHKTTGIGAGQKYRYRK